jgi:2-polyprenyl-3-methyl-5-hydroxy-6-metoxy-1,4-benzoquinol methylase
MLTHAEPSPDDDHLASEADDDPPVAAPGPALTARQQREYDYHRDHAAKAGDKADQPVSTEILYEPRRRPWNAYWSLYDRLIAADLAGKHVLVPGCGFGDDAIRLAMLGARVSAFDLSPASVEVARRRAALSGHDDIAFATMTAERMDYPDDSFDAVLFVDILHHVEIPATMAEVTRVLKPGGMIIGDELYTYSALQRVRTSRPVAALLYPLMRRWIYNSETPYITADEHKIDETEFGVVRAAMVSASIAYYGMAEGRLFPNRLVWASRIDRAAMRLAKPVAHLLGSRVVFTGRTVKSRPQ